MNSIFLIFGLESNSERNITRKLMSIITILSIIYSFIFSTLSYIHNELDSFYISWLIEVYIYTLSHVVYRKKHQKLIKLINKLSNRIEDKNINYCHYFYQLFGPFA